MVYLHYISCLRCTILVGNPQYHLKVIMEHHTFFFFCIPSYISGVHYSSSSSAFPAISLGFTILLLLLLLRSQLYLWGSLFFFLFCIPSYNSGVHYSSSSAFPAISLGFTILLFFFCVPSYISGVHHSSSSVFPAISLGFTILLHSQLYLWGSPFFFFCVPSYISGVHHSSSSSAFQVISVGFTILGKVFAYVTIF